jgi:GntR family transcriptional regulator
MKFQEQQGIYQQIANHLCEEILRGAWEVNARVPSVREYAAQISVNPNTVLRSYTYLEELGVLYNRRGIGFFVHENARHRIKDIHRQDFLARTLPQVFRQMELLEVSLEEVASQYADYRRQPRPPSP